MAEPAAKRTHSLWHEAYQARKGHGLRAHGWVLQRVKGSHYIFAKEGREEVIPVPNHGRDLTVGTQMSIMKIAGISREEL